MLDKPGLAKTPQLSNRIMKIHSKLSLSTIATVLTVETQEAATAAVPAHDIAADS